jgi:hypothetical protein
MKSEISERSLSMEKRKNSLILETNDPTDIYPLGYPSISMKLWERISLNFYKLKSAKFSNRFLTKAFPCIAFAQITPTAVLVLQSLIHKDFMRNSHCPVNNSRVTSQKPERNQFRRAIRDWVLSSKQYPQAL